MPFGPLQYVCWHAALHGTEPSNVLACRLGGFGDSQMSLYRLRSGGLGGETAIEIVSLDVPIVSAGLLSPFPSALDNATKDNTTSLIEGWIEAGGWHYNVQNQIWNTNYPQWYYPPIRPGHLEVLWVRLVIVFHAQVSV